MKNSNSFYHLFLMVVASCFLFINCTTDPIPGPPGADGADGIDGIDGVDGTASCTACHSNSHREPIEESFLKSGHYNQTVMFDGSLLAEYTNRGGGAGCATCHVSQGHVQYIETGSLKAEPYDDPAGISCKTCHGDHKSFDFENDGYDFALRNFEPVMLITDSEYVIDYENKSNNCAFCHQPRRLPPSDDGSGMYEITSTHWGPHYGVQSTLLEGIQGAEIAGSIDYPDVASAAHRSGSSCVDCHMGTTTDGSDGIHTFIPTDNTCTTCHSNGTPTEVAGLADDIAKLEQLLVDLGALEDGHPVPGVFTINQAKAVWNYRIMEQDASHGIHNPNYSRALIQNSIEALE